MRLSQISLAVPALLATLTLSGCAVTATSAFPDTDITTQVSPGGFQGSNFGGQSPIGGSHMFVLEAEASSNGYGGKATSLLSNSASGVTEDLTGTAATNPTYGMYYVTTGADGSFNITNEYTCTAGRPVYLYAQGGTSLPAQSPIKAAITKVVVGSTGASTSFELTTSTSESFYIGEPVTFSGFTGTDFAAKINGQSATVLSAGLTTTTFEVDLADLGSDVVAEGTYTTSNFGTAGVVKATPTSVNAQIVNVAMLGLCPGEAGEFAHTLNYVYMNEISTVAMAYAMGGFATNSTTGVVQDATHIGATTANLVGLQNAALNVGQLYDIQGGNVSSGGVGHIGRLNTAAGNGIVPQALLSTLGNLLAACVDSENTYNPYPATPTGTQSTQCGELFSNATTTGGASGGTAPVDTATAMLNIAHLPAGAAANSSSFMQTLYALQGTNAPFEPALTAQPNDFTVAIQYPLSSTAHPSVSNPAVSQPESIAVDASGNIWMNSRGNKTVFEMSPLGVVTYQSPAAAYSYGYVSVDPSGNIWSGNDFASSYETKFAVTTSSGQQAVTPETYKSTYPGGDFYDAYVTVTDSSGNAYVAATPPTGQSGYNSVWALSKLSSAGVSGSPISDGSSGAGYQITHGVVENASAGGDLWFTSENDSIIVRVSPTGTLASGFPITAGTSGITALNQPEMPAIDASSNLWVANQSSGSGGSVTKVTTGGAVSNTTGGTLDGPYGVAVDGLGNVWVTNRDESGTASSVVEFNGSTSAAISPTTNYTLGGQVSHPYNLAVDGSGVVWMTSYDSSMVVEMLGQAAPVVTPLSYAAGQNKLGSRP